MQSVILPVSWQSLFIEQSPKVSCVATGEGGGNGGGGEGGRPGIGGVVELLLPFSTLTAGLTGAEKEGGGPGIGGVVELLSGKIGHSCNVLFLFIPTAYVPSAEPICESETVLNRSNFKNIYSLVLVLNL